MGRSFKPKYAIDIFDTRMVNGRFETVRQESMAWDTKRHGRASTENLEKYVLAYGKSLEAGGPNAHLSEGLGFIPYPRRAIIRFNHTDGATVASWNAPTFMVW